MQSTSKMLVLKILLINTHDEGYFNNLTNKIINQNNFKK
jgi:hypothetical protein